MPFNLYRQLLQRLILAAALISAGVGGLTWWYEIERIDDAVVGFAVDEAGTFVSLYRPVFGSPAGGGDGSAGAAAALKHFLDTRSQHSAGHYVLAELYDPDRKVLAEASSGPAAAVERAFDRIEHVFPAPGHPASYDKVALGDDLFIRVVTEARNGAGQGIGYFEGIYHVATERLAEIRLGVVRTVTVIIVGVALATLLLFPTIVTLNQSVMAANQQLLRANLEMLEVLGGAIAKRDSDTADHNYRVTLYAVRLAEAAGLSEALIRELIKGAFLHDVGKIAISDAILLKPGRLTEAEFETMKTHVRHGRDIVSRSQWLKDAAAVVDGHHEKYDGSGYPDGLSGEAIPILARVFAIADVFDALASRRPYKEPMGRDKALGIITGDAGRHFDPGLVAVFATIAPQLHARLAERDEAALTEELLTVITRYFAMV